MITSLIRRTVNQLPDALIYAWLDSEATEDDRVFIAENRRLSPELKDTLLKDESTKVVCAVITSSPLSPATALELLSQDKRVEIACALAQRPSSRAVLKTLLSDTRIKVRSELVASSPDNKLVTHPDLSLQALDWVLSSKGRSNARLREGLAYLLFETTTRNLEAVVITKVLTALASGAAGSVRDVDLLSAHTDSAELWRQVAKATGPADRPRMVRILELRDKFPDQVPGDAKAILDSWVLPERKSPRTVAGKAGKACAKFTAKSPWFAVCAVVEDNTMDSAELIRALLTPRLVGKNPQDYVVLFHTRLGEDPVNLTRVLCETYEEHGWFKDEGEVDELVDLVYSHADKRGNSGIGVMLEYLLKHGQSVSSWMISRSAWAMEHPLELPAAWVLDDAPDLPAISESALELEIVRPGALRLIDRVGPTWMGSFQSLLDSVKDTLPPAPRKQTTS